MHNSNNLPVTIAGGTLMDSHREFLIHIAIIVIIELSFKIFGG